MSPGEGLFPGVALAVGIRLLCDADLRRRRADVLFTAERTTLRELVRVGERARLAATTMAPSELERLIREGV